MTFKQNHEKANTQHQILPKVIYKMVELGCPDLKLSSFDIISGGCANLNVKIMLEGETKPLLLRVYLRDKNSAILEQSLYKLLESKVPVPIIYYVGDIEEYHFAICQFIQGITLRDLLLSETKHNIEDIMKEVGLILANISKIEFAEAGFFDQNLNIIERTSRESYLTFADQLWQNQFICQTLSPAIINKSKDYLNKYAELLPNKNEKHLVHGDFDPANILVKQIEGKWKIAAILDWEFAFSGSIMFDVANMLRYAHHMPDIFKARFLEGLEDGAVVLPDNWQITAHLLNLVSLLDVLGRRDPKIRPNQCADTLLLIDHIIKELDKHNEKN
jgi:aminoglycoside phosphotransferase (APT) family kinase protein